jgi:hypothetical protein
MNYVPKFNRNIALFSFCLSIAVQANAAPSLSKLEYAADEVTLTGTNFGLSPKVVLFDNFDHGRKFADLLQSQGNKNNWAAGILPYKESDGNIAHRAKDPVQVAAGKKGLAQVMVDFPTDYKTALVSFSVKVPKGTTFAGATTPKTFPAMSSWKFSWLMSGSNGFQEADKFDVCLPQHPGGGNATLIGNSGNIAWLTGFTDWWEWDEYNHMTSFVKIADTNPIVTPIIYSFEAFNNVKHYYREGDNSKYLSTSFQLTDFKFNRINIPGWWGNGDNTKFDGLYDNMYVAVGDNALARVMVTNSPIFNASTFAIPVMAKSWANGKIVLDTDVLPQKPGLYIHIIDNKGAVSSNGLALSCAKCPKSPTPL